jgi:hypothetical protein
MTRNLGRKTMTFFVALIYIISIIIAVRTARGDKVFKQGDLSFLHFRHEYEGGSQLKTASSKCKAKTQNFQLSDLVSRSGARRFAPC